MLGRQPGVIRIKKVHLNKRPAIIGSELNWTIRFYRNTLTMLHLITTHISI